jgi:ribonuclease HI
MEIDIYTDAGITPKEGVRVSAFIIDEHENEYKHTEVITDNRIGELRKIFGLSKRHKVSRVSSTNFELYSIYSILSKFENTDIKITIYTDSLMSFDYIHGISKIKQNAKFPISILKKIKTMNINFEVRWVKGHARVYGDQKADWLAANCVSEYKLYQYLSTINKIGNVEELMKKCA